MIGVCRLWKEMFASDRIKYAHSSAVIAWTPINVTGLGVLIPMVSATAAAMAIAPIMFYRRGTFVFPIQTGETVSNKAVVYYDAATDAVTTTSSATTFLLGTAIEAGTATSGYVTVELLSFPFSAGNVSKEHLDSGIKPAYIDVAVGTITCSGLTSVESVSGLTGVLATDSGFAQVVVTGANINACVNSVTMSAGKIALTLSTPTGAGATIGYTIKRATA
jgi:hypothetical protein